MHLSSLQICKVLPRSYGRQNVKNGTNNNDLVNIMFNLSSEMEQEAVRAPTGGTLAANKKILKLFHLYFTVVCCLSVCRMKLKISVTSQLIRLFFSGNIICQLILWEF